jgi:hypothetical protein
MLDRRSCDVETITAPVPPLHHCKTCLTRGQHKQYMVWAQGDTTAMIERFTCPNGHEQWDEKVDAPTEPQRD